MVLFFVVTTMYLSSWYYFSSSLLCTCLIRFQHVNGLIVITLTFVLNTIYIIMMLFKTCLFICFIILTICYVLIILTICYVLFNALLSYIGTASTDGGNEG